MSAGREFHVCGAATENALRASSVRTHGTVSSGATDDRSGRAGAAGWIRSLRYAGVEVDITLNVELAKYMIIIYDMQVFCDFCE